MGIQYKNYGNTDNSNLINLIKILIIFLVSTMLIVTVIVLSSNNTKKEVVIKKEEPITTIAKEIDIIKKTIGKTGIKEINSSENFLEISIKKDVEEKKYLPLLIRYENFIKISYNSDESVYLKINKKVFK